MDDRKTREHIQAHADAVVRAAGRRASTGAAPAWAD